MYVQAVYLSYYVTQGPDEEVAVYNLISSLSVVAYCYLFLGSSEPRNMYKTQIHCFIGILTGK